MKKIWVHILWELAPILVGILLSYLFWRNNFLLAGIYLGLIGFLLKLKFQAGDWHALAIGFLVGLAVEVIGTSVSGYQVFVNPDFWGIPIWLPIAWAYGFLAMKRVGVLVHSSRQSRNFTDT